MDGWLEVADGVLVRRYRELDLSVGLVLGSEQALLIDTRGDHQQGEELAQAVRKVTSLPLQIAITHAHFDHCFGTGAFLPATVWASQGCAEHLAQTGAQQRTEWTAFYRSEGKHEVASALAETEPPLPDRPVSETVIDLGGRSARLVHPGRGHTDHDLVIEVVSAGVVFAGDLVEQGAPPAFEDSYPLEWPSTVDSLLALRPAVVVPGHGQPVDSEFVRAQRDELAALAALCREFHQAAISESSALAKSPYPREPTLTALYRPR